MANNETEGTRAVLESLKAQHESIFGESRLPQWVKDSLTRYVTDGIPTGDFLRAVLANDLQGAFGRADMGTAQVMAAIVSYVYNNVPRTMVGSYETVNDYVAYRMNERRAAVADQIAAKDGV